MSSSPLRLKRASGWFAAGREVQHAALLLSDGAFKLFVWLCLHAERGSGTLAISIAELARPLHKSPTEIAHHWDELTQAGACCCVGPGRIGIQDRFWPYEREPTDCARQALSAYIAEVRRMFLYPACVHSSFSAADEKIATEWNLRGVSLQQVERAIRLGTVRKYLSLLNNTGGTPITTLHYFAQLVAEVEHTQVSDSYWTYLAYKLRDFERQWQHLNSRTRSRIPETSETK